MTKLVVGKRYMKPRSINFPPLFSLYLTLWKTW